MKRALVASKAKVEGVVQEKFSGAPPQTPSCFAPPIKNSGGATVHWSQSVAEIQPFDWGGGQEPSISESGEMLLFDVVCWKT